MSMLIRLYPQAWRDRYEAEVRDLLAQRRPSIRDCLDLVRGAADAHLHPNLAAVSPEPTRWTHRVPGLLALAAGMVVTAATLSIAMGTGRDWGVAGDLLGAAFVLMLISLPGEYLAPYGRRIAVSFCAIAVGVAGASATDWWGPAVSLAISAEVVALSGLLAIAAIRAGVGARWRWTLLGLAIVVPLAVYGSLAVLRASAGVGLLPDGSPVVALAFLPYGLAWLVVGLRMTVRGSPTFTDAPLIPTPAREELPA